MHHPVIIPSSNVESRQREVEHAERWVVNNNLKVNVDKYYGGRLQQQTEPKVWEILSTTAVTWNKRVNTIKILGVTLSDDLSVGDHMHALISFAAPDSLCATSLRVLDDAALQTVFRAVGVSKLQYALCAWWALVEVFNCGR